MTQEATPVTVKVIVLAALLVSLGVSGLAVAPETCRTTFDAVARIRGQLFFFKDDYFWRLNRAGHLMTSQPIEVGSFWEGLPDTASISAAYERPDGAVVFFCGRHYWVFWERRAKPGYPRPLSDLGLPEELGAVDAALVSGHNEATYLIAGDKYWRFNELTGTVETDSPLPVDRLCRGLPHRLDAAFSDNKGHTFFLQGQHYWRCDSDRGRVRSYTPDLVAPRWLGCSLTECCLDALEDEIETHIWPGQRSGGFSEAQKAEGEGNGAAANGGTLRMAAAAVLVGLWGAL